MYTSSGKVLHIYGVPSLLGVRDCVGVAAQVKVDKPNNVMCKRMDKKHASLNVWQ